MSAIVWGGVELEPEVRDWYLALNEDQQGRVDFHIDRLAMEGPLLDEPHTKQLSGKLREFDRARKAMASCLAEGHTVEDDND